jgi:hypothetical protein
VYFTGDMRGPTRVFEMGSEAVYRPIIAPDGSIIILSTPPPMTFVVGNNPNGIDIFELG